MKIREINDDLNATERKIGAFIMENHEEVLHLTIAEFSARCATSQAGIVRFCKTMGFNGFKEIKTALTKDILAMAKVEESRDDRYSDIRGGESVVDIIAKVSATNMNSIADTRTLLDVHAMETAIQMLCQANRIDFYGVGASGLVALDAQQKFARIGKYCNGCVDPHVQITLAANLKPGDVAVLISYSGMTKDIYDSAVFAKESGATIVAICKYGKSHLAEIADLVLYTCTPEIAVRSGAMGSRIAQLTIIDMLFTGVAGHNAKALQKALNRSYTYSITKKLRP